MRKLRSSLLKSLVKPYLVLPLITLLAVAGWRAYRAYSLAFDTPGNNLLINGSFDELDEEKKPKHWRIQTDSIDSKVTLESVKGFVGGRGVRVDISAYNSGSLAIESPKVGVEPGRNYYFKSFYLTDTAHDLLVRYHYKDGSSRLKLLRHYPDYDYPWSTMAAGIKADHTVEAISFVVQLSNNGYMELDSAYVTAISESLIPEDCSGTNNLVPNANLSNTVSDKPIGWEPYSQGKNRAHNTLVREPSNSYLRSEITAFESGLTKWTYSPVRTESYARHCVSFDYRSNTKAEVIAEYMMQDGSTEYRYLGDVLASKEWTQYVTYTEAPAGAVGVKVAVELVGKGHIETDNHTLVKTPGEGAFKRPLISVTFDDGWLSSYSNGAESLKAFNFPATFYINPGEIDNPDFMSFDQLLELQKRGHQLASHGENHIDLTIFNGRKVGDDLTRAQKYLKSRLGVQEVDFASPYGKHDAVAAPYFRQLYTSHRGTQEGINTKQNMDLYDLKVLFVRRETSHQDISEAVNDAIKNNGWLILVYHQVEDTDDPFIVDLRTFEGHMQAVKQSGVRVKTVRDALIELQPQMK